MDPSAATDPNNAAAAALVLALMSTLVHKVIDFAKFVSAKEWPSVISQGLSFAGGVGVTFLAAASSIGTHVALYGTQLGAANGADKVLVGLALGSAASLTKDFINSRDNTDSAAVPTWGGQSGPDLGGHQSVPSAGIPPS